MGQHSNYEKKRGHRIEPKDSLPSTRNDNDGYREIDSFAEVEEHEPSMNDFSDDFLYENEWGHPAVNHRSEHRKLFITLFIAGAFFFGCIVWALVLLVSEEGQNIAQKNTANEQIKFEEKVTNRYRVIEEYLAAKTIQEKALYVRDPERVLPLMEKYYNVKRLIPEKVTGQFVEKAVMKKNGIIWQAKVRDTNSNDSNYIYVETSEDGISKVDWETDVNFQPSDLYSFKSSRSSQPHTFRALIQDAQMNGFHGFEFASYNKFRCFRLNFPDSEEYLWAFTVIGSELDKKMVNLMRQVAKRNQLKGRSIPVILEIRYPENGQSERCVHLDKLVQVGWIY